MYKFFIKFTRYYYLSQDQTAVFLLQYKKSGAEPGVIGSCARIHMDLFALYICTELFRLFVYRNSCAV